MQICNFNLFALEKSHLAPPMETTFQDTKKGAARTPVSPPLENRISESWELYFAGLCELMLPSAFSGLSIGTRFDWMNGWSPFSTGS